MATAGIVARYPDGDTAGLAIERLSRHGVDARRITLAGDGETGRTDRQAQRRTDAGTSGRLGRRLGAGVVRGGLLGALLGAVLVAVATSAGVAAIAVGAVAGAGAGAWLGGLTGLQSTPTMSRAWESTFGPGGDGEVTVVVEADDEAGLHAVEEALGGTGALEVRRVSDVDPTG